VKREGISLGLSRNPSKTATVSQTPSLSHALYYCFCVFFDAMLLTEASSFSSVTRFHFPPSLLPVSLANKREYYARYVTLQLQRAAWLIT
jgi:hypothetical protein